MKKGFEEILIWAAVCFMLVGSLLFLHFVVGINMLEPITFEFSL